MLEEHTVHHFQKDKTNTFTFIQFSIYSFYTACVQAVQVYHQSLQFYIVTVLVLVLVMSIVKSSFSWLSSRCRCHFHLTVV